MNHIQPLLVKFMDTARKTLDADKVTMFLHDPATKELWTAFIKDDAVREIRIPANEGVAGAVYQSGETINIADARNDPRHRSDIADQSGYTCQSMLVQPISNSKGIRIGVIQAINKNGGGRFTVDDETHIRKFAAQVAHTIENVGKWKSLIPGLGVVLGVAALAALLHWLLPTAVGKAIGVVLVAIILGLMIRNFFKLPVT
jgi:signal transduction protein with GAF and PtsI domain